LFSTTLTAEVLPRIWEKNPEEGRKKLGELRELTRGALAEMRTLLMELRPAAFAEAELKDLLRHLVNAFIARARIPVIADIQGDAALPFEIKEAFYRIAQETLHNIAKHSEADQVWVKLDYSALQIELMIRDNGQGFEVSRTLPDHLGLGIMRERAAQVGADYKISSQLGHGTTITVCWRKSES
jgi:signal transduction histidine kinase